MVESHAPVLEMLWEAQDPHHSLDGRFGFSNGQAAGRWVADTLDDRPADQPPVRDRARPHIVHLVHIHVRRQVTAGSGPPQRGRDLFTTTLQTTDAKNLQDLRLTGVVDGQPKQRRLEAPLSAYKDAILVTAR